jgi:shikimate dehydrogenase
MIRTGLTGYPLSHSLSPKLHEAAFAALSLHGEYLLYPVAPTETGGLARLTSRIRNGEILGLNVTIPHKQAIIALLDELTPSAQAIGAVNTLYMEDGKLVGDNTDAPGFHADLMRFLTNSISEKKALVMGAGGAARAVVYALLKDGWKVTLAVRRADISQAQALMESFKPQTGGSSMERVRLEAKDLGRLGNGIWLIVNATPIGMFPEVDSSPWPDHLLFPHGAAVYDLVYHPRQTRLVREAQAAGLQATTGLGMLVEQAVLSFACWTGQEVPREVMFVAVES